MEFKTYLIGLIILAIFSFPFVYDYFNKKKKENKLLNSLVDLAKTQNCIIKRHEYCGNFVLGLDINNNYIFFYKQNGEHIISQSVNLSEFKKCYVNNESITNKSKEGSFTTTKKVEICFTPKQSNQSEIRFQLYHADFNSQLSGEIQFSKKWSEFINDLLLKNK